MDSSEIKIKKATNESFMTLKSYKSLKNSRISSKKLTNLKTVNFFEEIPNFKKMKVCSLYFRATKREEGADVAFVPLSVAFLFILISFLRENPGNPVPVVFRSRSDGESALNRMNQQFDIFCFVHPVQALGAENKR